eukprot:gene17685-21125_t
MSWDQSSRIPVPDVRTETRKAAGNTPISDRVQWRRHKLCDDAQRFPVAAHALAYLAPCDAYAQDRAVSSASLAASMPPNP